MNTAKNRILNLSDFEFGDLQEKIAYLIGKIRAEDSLCSIRCCNNKIFVWSELSKGELTIHILL
jgi:hypothetical protein